MVGGGGGGPIWVVFQCGPLFYHGTSPLHHPPSSCHLCSTRPPVHQSHHSLPPCLVMTHLPSTHPRGISFFVSLPLVFPHLSLSLPHRPIIRDVFSLDKSHPTTVSLAPTRSATSIHWPLLISLPHLVCQITPAWSPLIHRFPSGAPVFTSASTSYHEVCLADLGGSMRRPPRPKGTELTGVISDPKEVVIEAVGGGWTSFPP
jgi:hypothetical protein